MDLVNIGMRLDFLLPDWRIILQNKLFLWGWGRLGKRDRFLVSSFAVN